MTLKSDQSSISCLVAILLKSIRECVFYTVDAFFSSLNNLLRNSSAILIHMKLSYEVVFSLSLLNSFDLMMLTMFEFNGKSFARRKRKENWTLVISIEVICLLTSIVSGATFKLLSVVESLTCSWFVWIPCCESIRFAVDSSNELILEREREKTKKKKEHD
jgi:hypothetical protein